MFFDLKRDWLWSFRQLAMYWVRILHFSINSVIGHQILINVTVIFVHFLFSSVTFLGLKHPVAGHPYRSWVLVMLLQFRLLSRLQVEDVDLFEINEVIMSCKSLDNDQYYFGMHLHHNFYILPKEAWDWSTKDQCQRRCNGHWTSFRCNR